MEITRTGYEPEEWNEAIHDQRPTFEDVTETLKVLAGKEGEIHWDSGDLASDWLDGVVRGEREAELGRLANASDYEYASLRERVDCADFYPKKGTIREIGRSWSHYNRARRGHSLSEALAWLERANEGQWSVRDMEKEILKVNPKPAPPPATLRDVLLQIGEQIKEARKTDHLDEGIDKLLKCAQADLQAAIGLGDVSFAASFSETVMNREAAHPVAEAGTDA